MGPAGVRRCALWGLLLLALASAWAAGTYADYLRDLAWRESTHNPRAGENSSYIGLFQMGRAALIDAGYMTPSGAWTGKNGATSKETFLASTDIQTQAIHDYNRVQWAWIQRQGLDQYIGQTVGGVEVTASGLLAGAHLVGRAGLGCYLAGRFCNAAGVTLRDGVPIDGKGTTVTEYMRKFGGNTLGLDSAAPLGLAYDSGYTPTYGGGSGTGTGSPGTDTGGTGSGAPGGGTGTDGTSGSPVLDPTEAFRLAAQVQPDRMASLIGMLGAGGSLLLGAWMIRGSYLGFGHGVMTARQFGVQTVRAILLVCCLVWLFTP